MNPDDVDPPLTNPIPTNGGDLHLSDDASSPSGRPIGIRPGRTRGDYTESSPLGTTYRSLMSWYPSAWLDQNGEALLGLLLDHAEARGIGRPSLAERAGLLAGGLREQLRQPSGRSVRTILVLGLGTAFSAMYLRYVTWAPSTNVPGAVWEFSNPLVITAALMTVAFVFSVTPLGRTTRFLALASAQSAVAIGVLGAWFGWQGPSWYTVALFAGFAVLGAIPSRARTLLLLLLMLVALVVVGVIAPSALVLIVDLGPVAWGITTLLGLALTATLVVSRRKRRTEG